MRLMRWADRLHQYSFEIVYRPGKENSVADSLSRTMSAEAKEHAQEAAAEAAQIAKIFGTPLLQAVKPSRLAQETSRDETLQLVQRHVRNGWPANRHQILQYKAFLWCEMNWQHLTSAFIGTIGL